MYIIQCARGTYYTGYTHDIAQRLAAHASGRGAKYLKGKGPLKLVYRKKYTYYKNALNAERRIKLMPRAQKKRLIDAYAASDMGNESISCQKK